MLETVSRPEDTMGRKTLFLYFMGLKSTGDKKGITRWLIQSDKISGSRRTDSVIGKRGCSRKTLYALPDNLRMDSMTIKIYIYTYIALLR